MRLALPVDSFETRDVAVVVIALAIIAYQALSTRRRLPLPPGPKGRLLTGNIHQLPREGLWRTFDQWSKQLGERRRTLRPKTLMLSDT